MWSRRPSTRPYALLVSVALLLSAVLPAAAQDTGAAPAAATLPQGEIAYVLDGNIWLHDLVSGASTQLTTDGDNRWPAWSPDGQTLLYTHAKGEEAYDLYTIDMAQAEPRLVAEDACCGGFGPDGERFAYIDLSGTDLRILATTLDATSVETLIDPLQYGRSIWPAGSLLWFKSLGEGLVIPAEVVEGSAESGLLEWRGILESAKVGSGYEELRPGFELQPPDVPEAITINSSVSIPPMMWAVSAPARDDGCSVGSGPGVDIAGHRCVFFVAPSGDSEYFRTNLAYPSLSADGLWLAAERYLPAPTRDEQELEGIVVYEVGSESETLVVEGGSQPAWRPAALLPSAAYRAAQPGERIVEIAPALSWQGSTFKVYYYATGDYGRSDSSLFAAPTPDFFDQHGITGILVTRDGEAVTDPTELRRIFALYRAAHTLYGNPLATVDLSWQEELGKVLNNPLFKVMEPVQVLRSRRDQMADAMRLLLTDSRAANEADALMDEALDQTPKTLEDALSAVGDIVADQRATNAMLGALSDELVEVYSEADDKLVSGSEMSKGLRLVARLLWTAQLQQERAGWLAAYADAFVDGPGSFDRDEIRAASTVLTEVEDAVGQRVNVAKGFVRDEALSRTLKLSGDAAATAMGALAQRIGQEAGVRLSGHAVSSALSAVGIGFTVNDILYGVDALWSNFTLAKRSDELRALFHEGRQAIEQRAREQTDASVYDGDLAERFRAAYLLEMIAAANAQRSYASGVAATYRLPNPLELLNWLRGQDWRAAVAGLKTRADELEQQAVESFGAPAFPDALVGLTVARAAALPATRTPTDDTWTEPVSGITFVRVPAGEFTMGSTDAQVDAALEMCNATRGNCERAWFEAETPQHQVTLDEYRIGLTEVTNAQFRPFVEGGGYDDESLWTEAGWAWRTGNRATQPFLWNDAEWNQPDHPVVGVSWHEAVAYTRWLTRESRREFRLPTEAEWEKACRGTDGRTWPWGEAPPDGSRLNFCDANCESEGKYAGADDGFKWTAPAGSYPAGASPHGALDLAGNVWEWTGSLYKPYPYDAGDGRENPDAEGTRTLRGGAFFISVALVRCAYRDYYDPDYGSGPVGFRVVSPGF